MICFCEDCGQKNVLSFRKPGNSRIIFKCTSCGYHNNYLLESVSDMKKGPDRDNGLDQYILIDQNGTVKSCNIDNPHKAAAAVLSCSEYSFSSNRAGRPDNGIQFKIFPQKNNKDFILFSCANLFLGMIKNSDSKIEHLMDNVKKIIDGDYLK